MFRTGIPNLSNGVATSLQYIKENFNAIGNGVTYYVDQVNGNDNNDGSQSAPFKTLQKAIDSVPMGGRVEIYLLSDYYLDEYEEIRIKNKTCKLYLGNRKLIRESIIIRPDNPNFARAGRFVIDHGNLYINVGDGQIIMSPNTTGKPLEPYSYALFNFQQDSTISGIYIYIGSSIGGNWCEVNDGQALISIYQWSNSRPAGVFVSLHPHYNRTLQLYGSNSWFINLQGAVAGIHAYIGNNDSTGYIKRDANLISVKDAIAGIIRDANGVPRNVISNIIL